MNKKIITVIAFVIVIIIVGIFIALNIFNSEQNENLSEENTQNNVNENIPNGENSEQTEINNNTETNNNEEGDNMNKQNEEIKINLIVNNKTFSATLNNNQTVRELIQNFPMTLNMSDLHSNEKYNYLDYSLTTNSSRPNRINAGDIKLYGTDCLVVFYETFSNSYSYTDLGKIDNVDDFVDELGSGSVNIRFELAN